MKPTQQEIIELAREAGIVFDERAMPYYERLVHLALERFGAGDGEPVALDHIACICDGELRYMSGRAAPSHDCELYAMPDGKAAPALYTHPSPADLRAEYLRGLEDAARVCDERANAVFPNTKQGLGFSFSQQWDATREADKNCAYAIRALKGNQ